jgi:hypothetical protein
MPPSVSHVDTIILASGTKAASNIRRGIVDDPSFPHVLKVDVAKLTLLGKENHGNQGPREWSIVTNYVTSMPAGDSIRLITSLRTLVCNETKIK